MQQEREILQDLSSPERSIRLLAIEKCLAGGDSSAALDALVARGGHENDDECRALLERAVAVVRQRMAGGAAGEGPGDPESFLRLYAEASANGRLETIARLPARVARALAPQVPKLVAAEESSLVKAALIRMIGRAWPRESITELGSYVGAPSISVRTAALDTLAQIAPGTLQQQLPQLLVNWDPRIRTLAIRTLAAIDLDEAVLHLEALLTTGSAAAKQAGLQACLFLDFAAVKTVLLNFLGSEPDPELLQRAGWLFESNPDPEVPYRLWELVELLPAPRAAVVRQVLQGACKVLDASKALGDAFPAYMDRLKNWIGGRKAVRFAQEITGALERGEPLPAEAEAALTRAVGLPAYREALAAAQQQWPLSEATRQYLGRLLQPLTPTQNPVSDRASDRPVSTVQAPPASGPAEKTAAAVSGSPAVGASPTVGVKSPETPVAALLTVDDIPRYGELTPSERIRLLGCLVKDDAARAAPFLRQVLVTSEAPADLLAVGLRAAVRLEIGELTGIAERAVKAEEPALVSAGIEYLGRFSPDAFFPFLGTYLQSNNARIKGTALRVLQEYDSAQAVSMLRAMLTGKNEQQRETALACMMHFKFPVVRPLLCELLLIGLPDREFDLGLCLFQANPERAGLYDLYRLEQKIGGLRAEKIKTVRRATTDFLCESRQIQAADRAKLDAELAQRFAREQEREAKPVPDYALRKLAPAMAANENPAEKVAGFLVAHAQPLAVAAVLTVLVIGAGWWATRESTSGSLRQYPLTPMPRVTTLHVGEMPLATPTALATGALDVPLPPDDCYVPQERKTAEANQRKHAERAAARAEALKALENQNRSPSADFTTGSGSP